MLLVKVGAGTQRSGIMDLLDIAPLEAAEGMLNIPAGMTAIDHDLSILDLSLASCESMSMLANKIKHGKFGLTAS